MSGTDNRLNSVFANQDSHSSDAFKGIFLGYFVGISLFNTTMSSLIREGVTEFGFPQGKLEYSKKKTNNEFDILKLTRQPGGQSNMV